MPSPAAFEPNAPIGAHLREWRRRRRLSQLDFALDAEISQKHLSFIESGRAAPSRQMVLRLAEVLEVPLRDRNRMLLAAGYAPVFSEKPLSDPEMRAAREAVERLIRAHEPYPALAVDRSWTMVSANGAVAPLLGLVADPALLEPPVNVLRLSLHPGGLAPAIANLAEWRSHLLKRLARQVETSADPALSSLLAELSAYPAPPDAPPADEGSGRVLVPLQLRVGEGILSFISTTTVFGTPVDVTLSELAVEAFFPADEATAAALRRSV
ncbi:helix-turn-helix transcriptional regulator [Enterovirga rhinocerotis]|nr:helix-turn-helix transcriptional regulator [Enterovirga rhinocerotis]